MNNQFYGDGSNLPEMHPDPIISKDILISALCAKLDSARVGLAAALQMNVVTPAALSMKNTVRWAMSETDPQTIGEAHANCG